MKAFLFFISLFYMVICKKETVSDLYDMLNDPAILSEIEKRLKLIDDDSEPFSDGQVGCYEKTATLAPGCSFIANSSLIIKTSESMQRGAEFLEDFKNISCPRECTKRCCENPKCDTAVYQDKDARKCFLFHCGDTGVCLFSYHSNYWRMSISEATHKSHGYIPGGATYIHEDELENLGSHDKQQDTTPEPVPTTTTTRPTTSLPCLGDYCASYESDCEDPHAECLMKTCRCRVGYHEKNQVCRKHCRVNEEFECENIKYGANGRQCVLSRYVCDGHPDCDDGSDEMNCPDKNKPDKKPSNSRPFEPGNKNGIFQGQPDTQKVTEPPHNAQKTTEKVVKQSTPKAATPSPTDAVKPVATDTNKIDAPKIDSQASTDTDESDNQEPVSSEQETGDQSVEESSPVKSNKNNSTEVKSGESKGDFLKILNDDAVEVESYTDSFQGPIVALALGLAITMMLLIIVGCRLRTVKRRLRKGRALHSNEADYLINGMYL